MRLVLKLPVLIWLLGLFCSCGAPEKWHTSTLLYFDTVCEVRLLCSEESFASGLASVKRVFEDIETHFSPGTTDLSSDLVLALYQKAKQVFLASDGCFDITVAPLMKVWGFRDNRYRVPSPADIRKALDRVGMENVRQEEGALRLSPGMGLDWGGIAKGFGVDLASRTLIDTGIAHGFLNAGGDLFCWGKNPDKNPWKVGIKHPREPGYIGIVALSGLGAATTGDYQRYFMRGGVRYHHVFDPRSGYPARGKQSVTVVGPEAVLCDALSTALFVSAQPADIIEKFPDYGAIILDENAEISRIGKSLDFVPVRR